MILLTLALFVFLQQIEYSEKYQDGKFEYRHVILPKDHARNLPKNRTLTELEWRNIGVQQSRGWEHYASHKPEPHILLFRRPLGTVSVWVAVLFYGGVFFLHLLMVSGQLSSSIFPAFTTCVDC